MSWKERRFESCSEIQSQPSLREDGLEAIPGFGSPSPSSVGMGLCSHAKVVVCNTLAGVRGGHVLKNVSLSSGSNNLVSL